MATSVPIRSPIRGSESFGDPADPLFALSQFYRAFNTRDLSLMAEVWEQSPEASMDNPVSGMLRGWDRIRPLARQIPRLSHPHDAHLSLP